MHTDQSQSPTSQRKRKKNMVYSVGDRTDIENDGHHAHTSPSQHIENEKKKWFLIDGWAGHKAVKIYYFIFDVRKFIFITVLNLKEYFLKTFH